MSKPYFLYVGNAYPHKNLERLISAAKDLAAEVVIVSPRSVFQSKLERVIKKHKVTNIRLLGFVEDEKLKKLYKGAVGFVYPSLSEGFGLPGLEAMEAGTVALVSEIAVFREIYQDKAIYFDSYDVTSIKQSMERVLAMNEEERGKMIREGREFVKRYSWRKMAKETLETYHEALKS